MWPRLFKKKVSSFSPLPYMIRSPSLFHIVLYVVCDNLCSCRMLLLHMKRCIFLLGHISLLCLWLLYCDLRLCGNWRQKWLFLLYFWRLMKSIEFIKVFIWIDQFFFIDKAVKVFRFISPFKDLILDFSWSKTRHLFKIFLVGIRI